MDAAIGHVKCSMNHHDQTYVLLENRVNAGYWIRETDLSFSFNKVGSFGVEAFPRREKGHKGSI